MKLILRLYSVGIFTFVLVMACNKIIIDSSEAYLYNDVNLIPASETALVLGAAKFSKNGNLNPYFQYRMEAAADLYHSRKVKQIIVSGDNHIVGYDEPTDMLDYLMQLGVPEEKIILDYAGFRTLDSVVRAKKVFNCEKLIIVSQKFHNQRAVYIARQNGIQATGYNARDVRSNSNLTHIREYGAKFLTILDLHLFKTNPKFL